MLFSTQKLGTTTLDPLSTKWRKQKFPHSEKEDADPTSEPQSYTTKRTDGCYEAHTHALGNLLRTDAHADLSHKQTEKK